MKGSAGNSRASALSLLGLVIRASSLLALDHRLEACATKMMQQPQPQTVFQHLSQQTQDFYLEAMDILDRAKVPYLVGGAYALAYYAGIVRHTKDFDVFLRKGDVKPALLAFEQDGYRTEYTHPHWVAKAFNHGDDKPDFVDFIYGSGNGLTAVDDVWFAHAVEGELFGRTVRLCPAEEIIWSKSFIMERDRFDGADVAHILLARADKLDWARMFRRFQTHERALLAHLLLFGYAYPSEQSRVPQRIMDELWEKIRATPPATEPICRGTFLSWNQYLPDVKERGYEDARLVPRGPLTAEQIARWTATPK
jgi:hypothetical protein